MKNLEKVTNVLFSNRRKMINKNIKKLLNDKKIDKLKDLNLTSRPSEIKPEIKSGSGIINFSSTRLMLLSWENNLN